MALLISAFTRKRKNVHRVWNNVEHVRQPLFIYFLFFLFFISHQSFFITIQIKKSITKQSHQSIKQSQTFFILLFKQKFNNTTI
jgi:hypothetical protein